MIESIQFTNFKALRQTRLPLAPFTLLLGPNGSGKSSVLQALCAIAGIVNNSPDNQLNRTSLLSVSAENRNEAVELRLTLRLKSQPIIATFQWERSRPPVCSLQHDNGKEIHGELSDLARNWLGRMQVFSLDYCAIAQPVPVNAEAGLQANGRGLSAVLDDLKDNHPEKWESLLKEMRQWLPEYDYILFDKPSPGQKAIALRTKTGRHRIPAEDLSQGTLIALALLTLNYLPSPPSLVGLEEIDRGLHPRLLRNLQDALYRLSYPDNSGASRPPIQVIATTHSPYLLDLYCEHPEEVVLAEKKGLEVEMKQLAQIDHFEDIIGESPLSEVWYSGVLGGVSVKP
ncbi:MAG: hypothetical protein KatS3mg105_0835 [Gemmatales bacterium]|nr:MAG: hypothetical protein KatS3mg105_0835 [Gemmatales bacterium]